MATILSKEMEKIRLESAQQMEHLHQQYKAEMAKLKEDLIYH